MILYGILHPTLPSESSTLSLHFIIHSLWSDNSYRSLHSLSQFIRRCHDTAILHCLYRCLIADINLNSFVLLTGKCLCHKLCELLLFLEGTDNLLCTLIIAQFRIFQKYSLHRLYRFPNRCQAEWYLPPHQEHR